MNLKLLHTQFPRFIIRPARTPFCDFRRYLFLFALFLSFHLWFSFSSKLCAQEDSLQILPVEADSSQSDSTEVKELFLINTTGQLSLHLLPGVTKYLGEFTDNSIGLMTNIAAMYHISPALSAGLNVGFGKIVYERRPRDFFIDSYRYHYGTLSSSVKETRMFSSQVHVGIHLFPTERICPYFLLGAGLVLYSPRDFENRATKYYPDRPFKQRYVTATIATGAGVDYYFYPWLAFSIEIYNNYSLIDDLDAFDSPFVRSKRLEDPAEQGKSYSTTTDANDSYINLSIGAKYFLFHRNDADNDKLTNEEEETLGTNPNDSDTDGDGLADYEEIKIYSTNALQFDTDEDGLNDYLEVMRDHTDPTGEDTDDDKLSDYDEVTQYKSNPLKRDSDDDGIPDKEEVRLRTDPKYFDTDHDGLTDYDEVFVFKTNPLAKDTDEDGLTDREELALRTDALNRDSDGDGLSDYDEIKLHQTNPSAADTDGDSLNDYLEVKQTGSSPLNRDTDGDGIADQSDQCPTMIGIPEFNGCPDSKSKSSPTTLRSRQLGDTLSVRAGLSIILDGVVFEEDKDVLKPESFPKLNEVKNLFNLYPNLIAEIRGFTDSRGPADMNKSVSLLRAQSIREYLIKQGIHPSKLIAIGFGEENPIASNRTREGRLQNRRIEFYIVSMGPEQNR